jgi:SpoVK/Ycf46/Vps4 family AAA+-type ATPase
MRALLLALLLVASPAAADTPAAAELCSAQAILALGPVSSRYIGETEKNLELRFENASAIAGASALLFDEADALFGRRAAEKNDAAAHPALSRLAIHRGPPVRLSGFGARALAAGYAKADPIRGVVVIERPPGTLIIETRGMGRSEGVRLARRLARLCAS